MPADAALIAEIPFFALLDEQERSTLAALLDTARYATGQILFRYGDPGDALFIVRTGRVQVFMESTTGEHIVLCDNGPHDLFGEVSLLDGGPRTASAVAMEDCEVVVMDRGDLLRLVEIHPHAALDLLTVMGRRLRETDALLRTRVSRNVNVAEAERMTLGERIADRVASFGGSWTFILIFGAVLVSWMAINAVLLSGHPFDPYPFILLNLVLSTLAAIQAPVIMMSQNRQSSKDRLKADLDYDVNLKAELEVAQLHTKFDRMYEEMLLRLSRLEKQATRSPGP